MKKTERILLAGSMLFVGYVIGSTRTLMTIKTDSELFAKLEAATRVRRKAAMGGYKSLSDADRKLALQEDYDFWVMANRAVIGKVIGTSDKEPSE